MNVIGTIKTKPVLVYTRNVFGPNTEVEDKTLRVIERNPEGDCLCLFDGSMGTNLVDVDHRDISK